MSLDEIFHLTAGAYRNFFIIYQPMQTLPQTACDWLALKQVFILMRAAENG